jgi:hypothetical protein
MRCDASSESHRFFFVVRSLCTSFFFVGRMRKRMRLKRNMLAAMRRLRATGSLSVGVFFYLFIQGRMSTRLKRLEHRSRLRCPRRCVCVCGFVRESSRLRCPRRCVCEGWFERECVLRAVDASDSPQLKVLLRRFKALFQRYSGAVRRC